MLDDLPEAITAVVSLCLVGNAHVPDRVEHVTFRLIDKPGEKHNRNLAFVLRDAAETVAALRDEGHVVLVHCVAAQSRTPSVGIAYAMLRGVDHDIATKGVCSALPGATRTMGLDRSLRLGQGEEEPPTVPDRMPRSAGSWLR